MGLSKHNMVKYLRPKSVSAHTFEFANKKVCAKTNFNFPNKKDVTAHQLEDREFIRKVQTKVKSGDMAKDAVEAFEQKNGVKFIDNVAVVNGIGLKKKFSWCDPRSWFWAWW